MENTKAKKVLLGILILLLVICLCVIVWQYIKLNSQSNNNVVTENNNSTLTNNNETNKESNNTDIKDNSKKFDVNDYVTVTEFEYEEGHKLKKIEFKNLPSELTNSFSSKHTKFINSFNDYNSEEYDSYLVNVVSTSIDKNNILSIYTKESIIGPNSLLSSYDSYTLNINLNTQKIVTNKELLEMYQVNSSDLFDKILSDIVVNVELDKFLLSTTGYIDADTITLNDFSKNIPSYATTLSNNYDIFSLYTLDNSLYVVYTQSNILSHLGMGSHMNAGLLREPQVLKVN